MRSLYRQRSAFTLVEIMIVVAIIGLLAAIAVPNFIKARITSQKNSCIANLKQIDGAVQQWGTEYKKTSTDTPAITDIVGPDLYIKTMPVCPGGGTYTFGTIGSNTTCSMSSSQGHSL